MVNENNPDNPIDAEKVAAYMYLNQYIDTIPSFEPFVQVTDEEVQQTDPKLVWSVATFDDGSHLINGFSESSAVDLYLKAAKRWEGEPFEIDAIEVYFLECDICEGEGDEDCFCEGSAMLEIDFARYLASTSPENRNPESLWAFRKPYGFEYHEN
jgi:hypothetical protein